MENPPEQIIQMQMDFSKAISRQEKPANDEIAGDDKDLTLLSNISEVVRSHLNGFQKSHTENILKTLQEKGLLNKTVESAQPFSRDQWFYEMRQKALIYGGIYLSGVLTAFVGAYFALAPIEKKIGENYTFGTLLSKAWPKLTDKERQRLKELF